MANSTVSLFHKIGRLIVPTLYDLNPHLKPAAKPVAKEAPPKKRGRPKKKPG